MSERVTFMGYMTDVAPVAAAADIAVLTSDSDEGTPVSLIEAAGRVRQSRQRLGVSPMSYLRAQAYWISRGRGRPADAIASLADEDLRRRMGRAASAHVLERFAVERLLNDMDSLYGELLRRRISASGGLEAG